MGLLDDAIREHLDLKRARGGDPAEIERMEREALGPVRREPTIGSARFETAEEHAPLPAEGGYPDDRDQLLDAGYHDSTAPHPHVQHEHLQHAHEDPYTEHSHDDPFDLGHEQPEQPKRRFLRRNRPPAPGDSGSLEPGFHEDHAVEPHAMLEQHEALEQHAGLEQYAATEQHEPLAQDELSQNPESPEPHGVGEAHSLGEHHESLAHHDLHEQHDAPGRPEAEVPPHLQFDHPPKRPRFSAEPPSLHPDTEDEPATGSHEPAPSAPAAPRQQPEDEAEVQETTEFDVQKHIAETRFQPDPETPAAPRPDAPTEKPAAEEEDVLEETPEFLQDTPEHDRLWFEQRPPRDFDFDG